MSYYKLFFILPIIVILIWNCFVPWSAEGIGFDLPKPLKIILFIFPWNTDLTWTLVVNNAIHELMMVLAIVDRSNIKANLVHSTCILVIFELIDIFFWFISICFYGTRKRETLVRMRDTISLEHLEGIHIAENEEYSCKYEYICNKRIVARKVLIIFPDAVFVTDINGNIRPARTDKNYEKRYNVGAYESLAEEVALKGSSVLKLERLSSYVLQDCNADLVYKIVSSILKKVGFFGDFILFFHGDNNRFIYEISSVFHGAKVISACNYLASKDATYEEKLKLTLAFSKVLCIEAKYDPRIKCKNKKQLSRISNLNFMYKYYDEMDFTLRKKDANTFNGGVDVWGRSFKNQDFKDIYQQVVLDIIQFID